MHAVSSRVRFFSFDFFFFYCNWCRRHTHTLITYQRILISLLSNACHNWSHKNYNCNCKEDLEFQLKCTKNFNFKLLKMKERKKNKINSMQINGQTTPLCVFNVSVVARFEKKRSNDYWNRCAVLIKCFERFFSISSYILTNERFG